VLLVCEIQVRYACSFISVFVKSAVLTAVLIRPAPHPSVPCLCCSFGRYHCDKSPPPHPGLSTLPPSRAVLCLPANGLSKVLLGKVVVDRGTGDSAVAGDVLGDCGCPEWSGGLGTVQRQETCLEIVVVQSGQGDWGQCSGRRRAWRLWLSRVVTESCCLVGCDGVLFQFAASRDPNISLHCIAVNFAFLLAIFKEPFGGGFSGTDVSHQTFC